MTKKLEELLDLAPVEVEQEIEELSDNYPEIFDDVDPETEETLEKISQSLPTVQGLGAASERELDDIAAKAVSAYEDLMDLGMNVEARYSTRVFEVASSMLRNALDAKNAKISNKLKMVELQLKQARLEHDKMGKTKGKNEDSSDTISGSAVIITDRNSLIERLKNMKS